MPYANKEVKKQKNKEYHARPEVKERNAELYRERYKNNANGLADKVKEKHYSRWQDPKYREQKKRQYLKRWDDNWEKQKIIQLKAKAKRANLEFSIDETDIVLPVKCPIFGIDLVRSKNVQSNSSPSVDRIDPNKGYVKGNVVVVSLKANAIKRDATISQLRKMVEFYENLKEDENDE